MKTTYSLDIKNVSLMKDETNDLNDNFVSLEYKNQSYINAQIWNYRVDREHTVILSPMMKMCLHQTRIFESIQSEFCCSLNKFYKYL